MQVPVINVIGKISPLTNAAKLTLRVLTALTGGLDQT